jgi:hypothetical protein
MALHFSVLPLEVGLKLSAWRPDWVGAGAWATEGWNLHLRSGLQQTTSADLDLCLSAFLTS